MNSDASHPKQILVWWVIWFAFLIGVVQIYFTLGKTSASSVARASFNFLGLVPFVVSSLIRWIVLPKMQLPQAALVAFIVGIAIAEASCFVGLFLMPAHKLELFVLSILGIIQFAPFFARRYFS
jgi:hypothetical protein